MVTHKSQELEAVTGISVLDDKLAELVQQFMRVAANDDNSHSTRTDIKKLLEQVICSIKEKVQNYGLFIDLNDAQIHDEIFAPLYTTSRKSG